MPKEYRSGVIAVPRTQAGEILLLPVQPEDVNGKDKHECVAVGRNEEPAGAYEKIRPEQRGFISGAIKKPADWQNGIQQVFSSALIREAKSELGLTISPEAISP